MVDINDFNKPTGSSPLYPRLPAHIHELGEMADKAKRRKHVLRKRLRRIKCLMALKRRHWEAIVEMAREHLEPESTQCFGTYASGSEKECYVWLKKQDPLCQACVITTKLLEVLDE